MNLAEARPGLVSNAALVQSLQRQLLNYIVGLSIRAQRNTQVHEVRSQLAEQVDSALHGKERIVGQIQHLQSWQLIPWEG